MTEDSPEILLQSDFSNANTNDGIHSDQLQYSQGNFDVKKSALNYKKDSKSNNNMTKNIIKQYFKFLINKKNSDLVSDFITNKPIKYSIKLIKKYFDKINYNNYTLIKIIKHENYGKGFEYFLTFEVLDGLAKSRVQNVDEYSELINYLKECCSDHGKINDIHYYKKGKPFY
ncbi:hypothetical protein TTHERM_00158530 (macronuclear) [Tetrahymena thermophila SB210]|uniref:Uncharacterized protein n=1 Tax=Tetrahymena thermophila (strain SB210) TaxID=312017 RepID=Q22W81_TETTS|nr:hypothetical protein TTHERM_00158530 [Tetrahymena thermophila SB210]EAR89536.2 hypothetical protein TTHERM_00158530 [Tetrahymena thermophila SB210]|eukprot:XP_001009781.2 hypothetical protein TTHERM_00158530 [Tetrahymena thermophila SB210]